MKILDDRFITSVSDSIYVCSVYSRYHIIETFAAVNSTLKP